MTLLHSRARPAAPVPFDPLAFFRRHWEEHRRRKAARDSLALLLDRRDDHLLDDIGLDRETGHRLLGEVPILPHRGWDHWQGIVLRSVDRPADRHLD